VVVTVVVACVLTGGCGSGDDAAPAAPATAGDRATPTQTATAPAVVPLSVRPRLPAAARTYVDRRDRLRLKLPPGWHRASDRATDRVSLMEGNLLAVGTFPIKPRSRDACSNDPGEPRVDVGPSDALIVVEEDIRARADLARERPRFRLLRQVAAPGESRRERTAVFPAWPCRSGVGVAGVWEPSFADGGRVFSVTAIVGRAASLRTRSETLGVLNSLRVLAG